jgi:amidase
VPYGDAMTDLTTLPAHDLARRIRGRAVSAAEVLDAHLERIERDNPALCAVVSLDADGARRRAVEADDALRRGENLGPLHGVPMTLKDGHDIAGLRTTIGTKAMDHVAERDGTVAARLRAAGANLIGHTNVPPWLGDYQSANKIFGRTANPWDLARTSGGSSGGAAAALAAGLTPLEIGSDLAGSIRLPAHFCGVYGLKTTEHRVPDTGFFLAPDGRPRPVRIMGSIGPMARDLDDLELALRIIAGPDGQGVDVPPVPLATRARRPLAGLRLAAATGLPGAVMARAVREPVERLAALAADAGATVEERLPDIDWDDVHELFNDLLRVITEAFDPNSELPAEQRELAWYLTALTRRDRLAAALDGYFADHDALVMPAGMTTAFPHVEDDPMIDVDGTPVSYERQGHALVFANLLGLPVLAVPAGLDAQGLPVGVQLVGPHWSELRLLEIAHELEESGILPGPTGLAR